jgi:hypothetical protein
LHCHDLLPRIIHTTMHINLLPCNHALTERGVR